MELDSLFTAEAHEEGAEVQINHPVSGEKTDVFIRLVGVDSKTFRKLARQRNRLRFAEERETPEEADARDLDLLADITLGWRGITHNGVEMPFTRENVRRLYENSPAIRAQVDSFILNRANFTKG